MGKYLDREKRLLCEMQKDGFNQFFDGDRSDAYDSIEKAMESFVRYAEVVARQQVLVPIDRARCEGQELRDSISSLDSLRHSCHESAIANIRMLNRISNAYGLGDFAEIDTTSRHEVAVFIGMFVSEIYDHGIHPLRDEITADD